MCLGIPCQVNADPAGESVQVRDGDRLLQVSLLTLPDSAPLRVGDWLLVHCGLVLARLTEAEAHDALALRSFEETS